MDLRVFAYLALICLGTAVMFGLAPALHIAKTDVNEILKKVADPARPACACAAGPARWWSQSSRSPSSCSPAPAS